MPLNAEKYSTICKEDISTSEWFVMNMYTKSLARVETSLENSGLKYFFARCNKLKKCGGKMIQVRENIIPGVFFVYATYQQVQSFQRMYAFLGFATYQADGKRIIMKVPSKEMENFIAFVDNTDTEINFYRPEDLALEKGTKIRITGGELSGVECVLTRFKGKHKKCLAVTIPSLGTVTTVYLKPDYVEIL